MKSSSRNSPFCRSSPRGSSLSKYAVNQPIPLQKKTYSYWCYPLDVQVQTIVLQQHNGLALFYSPACGRVLTFTVIRALQVFRDDIQRKTVTRQVGFDEQVASKFSQVVKEDGTLSVDDNGFSGSDVGKNLVVPSGNNWDDSTGPARVQAALDASESALNSTSSQ